MEYLLVFDLPNAFETFRHRAQRALSRELNIFSRLGRTPAHVTVKYSFSGQRSFDEIRRLVRALPKETSLTPIAARIGPAAAFDGSIVYLPLVGEQVKAAMERILRFFEGSGIPRQELEGKTPHMTVVKDIPERHIQLVLGHLGSIPPPPASVELAELVLYGRETRDASRREVERIYL